MIPYQEHTKDASHYLKRATEKRGQLRFINPNMKKAVADLLLFFLLIGL
jgi:hypothetical protein